MMDSFYSKSIKMTKVWQRVAGKLLTQNEIDGFQGLGFETAANIIEQLEDAGAQENQVVSETSEGYWF